MSSEIFKEYEGKLPLPILEKAKELAKKYKLEGTKLKRALERIYQEYENSKIEPGEAIGIVTAESFGEPATQMSIAYDEKVIVKENGKFKRVKIGEFVDNLMKNGNVINFNGHEVMDVSGLNVYVPSLDQDEKIKWKKLLSVSRHKLNGKLLKIKTRSGREIIATDSHSFVVRKNNKIVPISGKCLTPGQRIPIIRYLPICEELSEISIGEIFPKNNYWYGEEFNRALSLGRNYIKGYGVDYVVPVKIDQLRNYVYKKQHANLKNDYIYPYPLQNKTQKLKENFELSTLTGWFFGAYLSEGTLTDNSVFISNINNCFFKNLKLFSKNFGFKFSRREKKGQFGESVSLVINSKMLSKFVEHYFGKGSSLKRLPDFVFEANEKFICALLRAYFDGDGNVSVSRKMIRVSSKSKDLIDDVALLLSRIGIFAKKKQDKRGYYWLYIDYKYAKLFEEKIGFEIKQKKQALTKLTNEKKHADIVEMIPGYGDLFLNLGKKLKLPSRLTKKLTKKQLIGKCTLERYYFKFLKLAKEKNVDITKELEIIRKMLDSDVVWDEIVEVSYVDYDREYVYDFSVDGLETFVTADGIVTHNTLNVFHFAGVSEMNITAGLPRLIEIFDARKEASTPLMEVYLKKKYSTPAKVKEVAAKLKGYTLKDIVSEFSLDFANLAVVAKLNRDVLKRIEITPKIVAEKLKEELKNVEIEQAGDKIILSLKLSKEEEFKVTDLYKLKEKCKEIYVHGIKGITQVLPMKVHDEYVIFCAGSNLKDVLNMEEVDAKRVRTNNIFEIAKVLGIEAARQAIIDEALKVIKEQGLDIDMRHIMFIADAMTRTGKIRGVTRTGITKTKESVLAKASFETPLHYLVRASIRGEKDPLTSVVENVMLNQPVPVGTGLPGLVVKIAGTKSLNSKSSSKETQKNDSNTTES